MFFLVRVDLEIDLNSLLFGGGFEQAADGAGGEAVFADENGDVLFFHDEAEAEVIRVYLCDAELGGFGVIDELDGDVLQETA